MENEYITRKERRELRRQEQKNQQGSGNSGRFIRKLLIWGGSLLVIAGFGWGIVWLANSAQTPGASGVLTVPVSASDHALGPDTAPIVLVEYSDYQCPACGAFYPLIKQAMAEPDLKGRVKLVYRNFPLTQIHPNAQLSAQAAEAAALQGKFWEMHDALFEGQAKWSGMSDAAARAQFTTYATTLGLNIPKFTTDIDSTQVKDRIAADVAGANTAGINGTPTFYVNGMKMPQPGSYQQFKEYIANGIR